MVVTRKGPLTPLPPTSRSASSQAVNRVTKAKSPLRASESNATDSDHEQDNEQTPPLETRSATGGNDVTTANGPPSPQKQPGKGKKSKQKKHKSRKEKAFLVDLLSRMFLLFFIIYSTSVCPTDEHLKSPVCRGLSEYRRLIIDPYIIPPIQRALTHPSVAPYTIPVYNIAIRTTNSATPVIQRTKLEWQNRVVPQWNAHVVPIWTKHASPYVERVNAFLGPYQFILGKQYDRHVVPLVHQAQRLARRSQPYIAAALDKIYNGYLVAKPYIVRGASHLQHVPPLFMRYVARPLGRARALYVDPHVTRMWDKIQEFSSKKTKLKAPLFTTQARPSASASASTSTSTRRSRSRSPVPEPSTKLNPLPVDDEFAQSVDAATKSIMDLFSQLVGDDQQATILGGEFTETLPVPVKETAAPQPSESSTPSQPLSSSTASVSTSTSSPPAVTSSELPTEVTDEPESTPTSSTQVVFAEDPSSESAEPTAESSAEPTQVVEETPLPVASLTPEAESVEPVKPPAEPTIPAVTPEEHGSDDDLDLDAFYAELELDDAGAPPETLSQSQLDQPAQTPELSDEEKAEIQRIRLQETAEKRRDIQARHADWEEKLQELAQAHRKSLRKSLVAMRKQAASEMKASDKFRVEYQKLHAETEKALKGTDAYLLKIKNEERELGEKAKLWEKVALRVQEKFYDKVTAVAQVVNEWYDGTVLAELGLIETLGAEIKDMAGTAQGDIGMDYAWLDDVTYMDWQRYHALMKVHTVFIDTANAIQNGTHPSPPINPVFAAIEDLRSEMEDIVTGFETRLRRIKREGDRIFRSNDEDETPAHPHDEEGSEEHQEGTEPESRSEAQPPHIVTDGSGDIGILPIPEPDATPLGDPQSPVIGKGKVEVEGAIGRAEQLGEHVLGDEELKEAQAQLDNSKPASSDPVVEHVEL